RGLRGEGCSDDDDCSVSGEVDCCRAHVDAEGAWWSDHSEVCLYALGSEQGFDCVDVVEARLSDGNVEREAERCTVEDAIAYELVVEGDLDLGKTRITG